MVTQEQLDQVMAEHPQLGDFGLGIYRGIKRVTEDEAAEKLAADRVQLQSSLADVRIAAEWIDEHWTEIYEFSGKRGNYKGSYGWKHTLETDLQYYLTNGVFIAAALLVGMPHSTVPGNPNIYFTSPRKRRARRRK